MVMEACVMRYIVPFAYQYAKKGRAYDIINECLENNPNWRNIYWEQGEQDCYDYLKKLYPKYEDDYQLQSGVGTIWEYHEEDNKNSFLPSILYKDEDAVINARISAAGLFVLKNGVGLFWYETDFFDPNKKKKEKVKIDLEQLICYQNQIKELAQTDKNYQLIFSGEMRFLREDIEPKEQEEAVLKEKLRESKAVIEDITDVTLLKLAYFTNPKIGKEQISVNYKLTSDMPLGCWIHKMLSVLGCEIAYYPERKRKSSGESGCYSIADKAILFQYVAADIERSQLRELAYFLTHGYKRSYEMPRYIRKRMYEPFGNIIWYAEKEGCGIYANYNEDNKSFITQNMKARVCNDYFFLYMNLLQQSYVILNLAEEIATTLSMSENDYQRGNLKMGEKLEDIQMRINIFLVKSTHASVSHIGHHNAFYEYVEKNLLIKEDIESLREGLDSLEEIQQRHEDDKVTIALSVLSVFAILSAFGDAGGLIDLFVTNTPETALLISNLKMVAYIIIGIIFLLVFVALKDNHIKFLQIAFGELKWDCRKSRKRKPSKKKRRKI